MKPQGLMVLLVVLFALACTPSYDPTIQYESGPLTIITQDHVKIAATFYKANTTSPAWVLVPMLGSNQSAYDLAVHSLMGKGYNVLTIDPRGHGDSEGDWRSFTSDDFNAITQDIEAAVTLLRNQQIVDHNIILMGADLGANVVINYAATDPTIPHVILLSPGLEYHGVETGLSMKAYNRSHEIVVAVDDLSSYESARTLDESSPSKQKALRTFQGNKHGTDLITETLMYDLIFDAKESLG